MTYTVKTTTGKTVRTTDNPLNTWVRCIHTGRFYRNAR